MRTVTVTGDALDLEDLVAVARGQADAEMGARRRGPDGAQPGGGHRRRRAGQGDVRHHHRVRRARGHPRRAGRPRADAARPDPLAQRRRRGAAAGRRRARPAAAARPDPDRRLLRRRHRPAGKAARAARPRPAAGDPRARGRSARPATWPSSRTWPSRWSARAGCAAAATGPARPPERRAARRGGRRASGAGRQGGPVPDQRHRADAGAAGAGGRRDRPAGQGRRHRLPR